jgi:EAL domain-containing protein (putative c-di-GMP-specific phosphodiesterase class I)
MRFTIRRPRAGAWQRSIRQKTKAACRNLELECIVEGVETAKQHAILRKIGCYIFQGYLFGRPMPSCELPAYLAGSAADTTAARLATKAVS